MLIDQLLLKALVEMYGRALLLTLIAPLLVNTLPWISK
jgi:hypothetical protein